jgi:pimeloyl-ACP methyl ester carboxylesterase
MVTYVFLAGGGYGGYIWKEVASRLRAHRHEVFTPTLTGLGERAHLASPQIDLDTHVHDILGVFEFEDLHDVILVGHSYGGMVMTGVAQHIPHRLAHLVYLDALVPQDGQSVLDIIGPFWSARFEERARTLGDGWRLPPFSEMTSGVNAKTTAYPFQCFKQPLSLKNPAACSIPRTFISCTESGWSAEHILPLARRAREEGWNYYELATGHLAMITHPKELAYLLLEIAEGAPVC